LLDRLVELAAQALDALGLNGTRLRWKWNKRRRDLGEAGLKATMVVRSTQGTYKMCPSCRALVPRAARTCTECNAPLAGVRAPGVTRVLASLIPGTTATSAGLLLANTAMFAIVLMLPFRAPGYEPGEPFGRLLSFDDLSLIRYGSGYAPLTLGLHEWWRLITPVFLHGGLLHLIFNSMVLVRLGPLVEEEFGTERLAAIYVACGLAGSAASQFLRHSHTVGASGALCGLLGLLLVHGWKIGGSYGARLRSVMLQNVLLIAVMSFFPSIDWMNHLGGFVAGGVLGAITPSGPFRNRVTEALWQVLAWGAVAIIGISMWAMATRGVSDALLELRRGA
jgi:membrane associated rhomboid family serine protease